MLTILEIKTNAPKVFARQTDESKNANLAILNYIDHMAKTTNININAWDIGTMFKDPTNKKQSLELLKDRNAINKIFFEQVEKTKANPNAETQKVSDAIRSNLAKISVARKAQRLKSLDNDIKYRLNDLDQTIRRINEYVASIAKMKKEVAELEGGNTEEKIISDLEEIMNGNFFEFHSVNGTDITFVTRNDVINTLIKPSANLNIKVNLGKFKIVFNMNSLALAVLPFDNNTFVSNYYHPHVSSNGNICWGDASDHVSKLLVKFDIKNAMMILATLLTTYNESNPYAKLYDFAKAQGQKTEELPF